MLLLFVIQVLQIGGRWSAKALGACHGFFPATTYKVRNFDTGKWTLEAGKGDFESVGRENISGNDLACLGFNSDAVLFIPRVNHKVLDTISLFSVGIEVTDDNTSILRHETPGRLECLLPFGDHTDGVTERNGIKPTVLVVPQILGQLGADIL